MENNEELKKIIYKDYSEKIKSKLPQNIKIETTDINELIAILNFSFQKKNDFFVKNFNKKCIKNVFITYNQIKTNILTPTIYEIFYQINEDNLKLLRFIVINFVNNYKIIDTEENKELCSYITLDSQKRCLNFLNSVLEEKKSL